MDSISSLSVESYTMVNTPAFNATLVCPPPKPKVEINGIAFITGAEARDAAEKLFAGSDKAKLITGTFEGLDRADDVIAVHGNVVFKRAIGDTTSIERLQQQAEIALREYETSSAAVFIHKDRQSKKEPLMVIMRSGLSSSELELYKRIFGESDESYADNFKNIEKLACNDLISTERFKEISSLKSSAYADGIVTWYFEEGFKTKNGHIYPFLILLHEIAHNLAPNITPEHQKWTPERREPTQLIEQYLSFHRLENTNAPLDINNNGVDDWQECDIQSGQDGLIAPLGDRQIIESINHTQQEQAATYMEKAHLQQRQSHLGLTTSSPEYNPGRATYTEIDSSNSVYYAADVQAGPPGK